MADIDLAELRKCLSYNPETGIFVWRKLRNCRVKPGDAAGSPFSNGYIGIRFNLRRYLAHRLAWFYVHGEWPAGQIDHINGDRADNRISNLRVADQSHNNANFRRPKRNKTGFRGVHPSPCKPGRWVARITKYGKSYSLGSYDSPVLAHDAYCAKARELYGEFANE